MVYSMITGDMLTFGIIYMVVLFGFSQSFYFLYKGFPGVKSSLYNSYHSTWMALFQITLGDYNYTDLSYTTYPNLSKTVFAIFMVLVPILLLNMLIAMMGNTYAHVIEQSEKEWVKQWAKIVVSLERAVSQKDAHNYLQEYSIKLGPGDDPNNPASEQRGVMVIKSKSKTRAKQRKGAVANWKRVGKVTINELRKRGMTGEELRRIMWGRASFSTPVRASPKIGEPEVTGPTLTAGFGDALTAALDVMAFAHDLDLTTVGETAPNNVDRVKESTRQGKPADMKKVPQNGDQGRSQLLGITELIERKTVDAPSTGDNDPPFGPASMNSTAARVNGEYAADPLLDFIIASENPECDYESLLEAAKSARLMSESSVKGVFEPQILDRFPFVKGFADNAHQRPLAQQKRYLVETSDNDLSSNENLLGIEARLRRIRSANSRFVKTKKGARCRDDSSSSSSISNDGHPSYQPLLNQPEEASHVEGSGVNGPGATTTTMTTTTRNGGITKGNGSYAASGNKTHKRRPKTARNRVTPKEIEEPSRRRESIERNKVVSPPTSPTDPLEPWSTRGIKDMNAILAWKENGPDSP